MLPYFNFDRKCTERKTGQDFAVKIVSRRVSCVQEVKTLKLCQGHPNIVQLHGEYKDEVSMHLIVEGIVLCKE